jgi:hypothetical protein
MSSIVQAIHRVTKVSTDIASDALEHLISARLAPDVSTDQREDDSIREWMEKACVTLTMLVTKDAASSCQALVGRLLRVYSSVTDQAGPALSPKATHAVQTLVWKVMGAATPEDAAQWCDLLRHPLFSHAGHVNKARIGRQVGRN